MLTLTTAAAWSADAAVTCLHRSRQDLLISIAFPAILLLLVPFLMFRAERVRAGYLTALPILGLVAIAAEAVVTHDPSASSQLFLCLPVLYAATQLSVPMAYANLGTAIAAEVVLVGAQRPFSDAVNDCFYATVTFAAITVLLVRAGRDQRRLADILRAQASTDSLTGLVTRRVFDEATSTALVGAHSHDGTALILMDVDRFKSINDTHGHPVGDQALIHIADIIAAHTRKDAVISRLGGDELAVLLPGCDHDTAVRRGQQLVEAVHSNPLELPDGTLVPMSISAGIAHAPSNARQTVDLYTAADAALYAAKSSGRNAARAATT